jgi:HAD superfamily hydrolase (TIGR01484 family)
MTIRPISEAHSALRKITLIASDIDGTITSNGRLSGNIFNSFQALRKAGVRIILITGRSAGWVNGLASLLPVDGAIAENGGIFFPPGENSPGRELVPLKGSRAEHREALHHMFRVLQKEFPHITAATDNAYRITDWTFSVGGLSTSDLQRMKQLCAEKNWGFTYSNIQCHIMQKHQNKASALLNIIQNEHTLYANTLEVLTVGDSPNDESLFDPSIFPCSVGVANLIQHKANLKHLPVFLTTAPESDGFCEMATTLLKARR